MVTLATVIMAAIGDITAATAAMHRRITVAMPPLIMADTLRITTAMHRRIPAIDTVGLFVQHTPIMAAPDMSGITATTATIATGELRKLR